MTTLGQDLIQGVREALAITRGEAGPTRIVVPAEVHGRRFAYPALLEPGGNGGFVVTFPDVPEATTQGTNVPDALAQAADALATALLLYAKEGRPFPEVAPPAR